MNSEDRTSRVAVLIGTQLGAYHLEAYLGEGSAARVYRAREVHTQAVVAVKVISPGTQQDPDALERFEREAQVIAQIDHPHIVRLYHYGQDKGLRYMAVQFVDGPDLESMLQSMRQQGKWVPYREAARLVGEIGQALDYIHGLELVHRDVKAPNVLLDSRGHSYLSDFGLVLLQPIGTRGEVLGSPHYLAPEQAISSAHATALSDLYSLGVIAYELFTGRLPFDDPDPLEVALQQMTRQPPAPGSLRPELPAALEQVLLRALDKQPAKRYPSGAALTAAIRQAVGV